MMHKIYNLEKFKERRKILRNNLTEAEVILWFYIKNKKLRYKFRRQHGIDKYIVDFYCPELKLVIEVDGDSHYIDNEALKRDNNRANFIKNKGIKIVRYTNIDVKNNIRGVIDDLIKVCDKRKQTTPNPS